MIIRAILCFLMGHSPIELGFTDNYINDNPDKFDTQKWWECTRCKKRYKTYICYETEDTK